MPRGFSLIEVVITIGIIGAILVTFQAVLSSSTLVRTARYSGVALGLAESELDALRKGGYSALPATGPVSDSNLSLLPQSAENATVADFADNIKQVTVSVSWVDPSAGSRSVSLSTLVAKTGGLP